MARSPKTPDTTTKPATPRAEIPASPPVTFNLDDVNKIVSEALAKQAAAMAVAKHSNGKSDFSTKNDWTCTKAFKKLGITAKPRVDTFTFNIWCSKGFRPVEGSKAVRVNNLRLFTRAKCDRFPTKKSRRGRSSLIRR